MNYLKNKQVYLSGPIQHNEDASVGWRDKAKAILNKYELNIFDPFEDPKQQWFPKIKEAVKQKDFKTMKKIAKAFVRKDLTVVDNSNFIVANLPYKVCTTGTYHEIINSNNAKKPTLIVCEQGKEYAPLWLWGFIPEEFFFGSWEELDGYLNQVNLGLNNHDRWDFVCNRI